MEQLEILKAAFAVALADGSLQRCEKGVLQGLAVKAGIGRISFDAMLEAAGQGADNIVDNMLLRSRESAKRALELLVSMARLDGVISDSEREVLVRIGVSLKIDGEDFQQIYVRGIERADRVRQRRV